MTISDDRAVTVAGLREILGLPSERPDGVRDLLAVPREPGTPIPVAGPGAWQLALGDWPEAWQSEPGTGPGFLVMLHGIASPFFVATVEQIDRARWGEDSGADPDRREVPVTGTAYAATAVVAGCQLDADLVFGWPRPEEQYAFL
jgi:hypothetical protein